MPTTVQPVPVIPFYLHYRDPDERPRALCGAPVFSPSTIYRGNYADDYLDVTCPTCIAQLQGRLDQ